MSLDRRHLMTAAGTGLAASWSVGVSAQATAASTKGPADTATPGDLGLSLKAGQDVSAILQAAIDQTASRGVGLRLPPGTFSVGRPINLRSGTALSGALGATVLVFGNGAGLIGQSVDKIRIEDLVLDGAHAALDTARGIEGLVTLTNSAVVRLAGLEVRYSLGNGLVLKAVSAAVDGCRIHGVRRAGLFSLDGKGLRITHNSIHDCGDNGILIWTSKPAECGTIVQGNRIERIAAKSGGTGQYGNGINVYRAAGVMVANNRIADCAYSAIRGNGASNIQMVANSCARLAEVALYAEFGFEGALIANNLVDTAAAGISVTNFNEGGRLAIVQGNLVRNLSRRENEPEDKRGEGISVEADSIVSNNVIENASTAGIFIGWGRHMRDVSATGNLIRNSTIGIAVQAEKSGGGLGGLLGGASAATGGSVLLANNMISGARNGAIRTLRLHEAFGADLARTTSSPFANITCAGNVAT
jgi:uncharacterized secreted repeat protein (TIGR03808 family)